MLTKNQIRKILDLLSYEPVAEFGNGNYRVVQKKHGYSEDKEIGALQAHFSIALEAARE